MEGDWIKINEWLYPLSWLYRMGVGIRNKLFDWGILPSEAFDVPVISVGNITVGGTGKTPHVEYLVRLLKEVCTVAVLSRGYKRSTRGFLLADESTTAREIGDEAYQMKLKYPFISMAVDKNRREGIRLLSDNQQTGVILLDDAFQHRYVRPGINILLTDYHRLICDDALLPAGRLREPKKSKDRANIVIVTKCPRTIKPMDFRVLSKALSLYPYQKLFFTTFKYTHIYPLFTNKKQDISLTEILEDEEILLVAGVAQPKQVEDDLAIYCKHITLMPFSDHHSFKERDLIRIREAFDNLKGKHKRIITTEKDAARLRTIVNDEVLKENLFVLPVEVEFLLDEEEQFNQTIIGYVQKNSRNSVLVKSQNAHKSQNSNNNGNGSRKISFRYN